LDAHHSGATRGEKVIVGADRPGGGIQQDMGRLSAVVIPRGAKPHLHRRTANHVVTHRIPEGSPGSGGWRVIYSLKLKHLEPGEVIAATARERTGIGGLPYSTFISSELLIGPSRHATHPFGHVISLDGLLTEANGFNCTQGPSAYRTPCLTRKARRVVRSLGPGQFPPLATGGVLRASAEIKVSTTCPASGPRCIGRRYDFSPKFSAQIVLAGARNSTHGSGVFAVTPPVQHGC